MKTLVNTLSRFFYQRNLGLLLLRVATGLIFLSHGWSKVGDLAKTSAMFAQMGFAPEAGVFIAWLEVIGGAALILGVLTRVFAVAFGIEMLVAVFLMGFGRGLGIDFLLSAVSFALALMGSGKFSLYRLECNRCSGMLCDGKSCEAA